MKNIVIGVKFFIAATILTGLFYPLFITLIGQTFFSPSSNGRLDLIAQKFDQDKYFWSRPSSQDYNPLPSGGSNLSATSKQLKDTVEGRKQQLLKADPTKTVAEVPADLIYASGSGLDPHLSPAAAVFQLTRVVKARGLDSAMKGEIIKLIAKSTEGRDLNLFGEPRVNVLKLNAELDNIR
ncbi:MAG: potassium-transporting ATPase subunit C [Candidatus Margulisiibacteriota bacterium]